ncbi:hypothetical protein COS91_07550 [Candidatus Desantisbacteria bacterium CG07_land_8_20_14_0_80_39_15]|uniref:Uncharacterized protein n=1 Tax=Candidatus Desantisbacteria bacterium CG07_land_8_20_14_0_80_39_15 TaxID=1974549 RepID=A0A2M6ZEQ7_9BACT|nr:MAG: hypothetical protein COS91_07550 [Candidatus Desantisbacteria bacterium CG07_land_8_20_14_0_80_39_15]
MKIKFIPKINFYELEYFLKKGTFEIKINNDHVYNSVEKLISLPFTSRKDKFEERWECFYLPAKRNGRLITIPFEVLEYKGEFFLLFHLLGNLHIRKGKEKVEKIYNEIFKEVSKFIPFIKANVKVLEKTVPYDFRKGKIKGKYVLERLIPTREKEEVLKNYQQHLKKDLKMPGNSLNNYLHVASLCYKAAYGKKAEKLSPEQAYKKWADGRDGGMLSIKNWDSKKEFKNWYESRRWAGSHPFEIVFSWHRHGIHLYPPSASNSLKYLLRVTNYAYAENFVWMAKVLIKNKIPFIAPDLEDVLNYLAGETYFTVNGYSEHNFSYIPSTEYKKLYFPYIEWDELKLLHWKRGKNNVCPGHWPE